MARARPDEEARRIFQKYHISQPPVPIEDIAMAEGAQIVRQHSSGPESGFALREGGKWIIGINTQTSRRRQRFSVAHELGHLLLHEGTLIVSSVRIDLRDGVSSLGTDKQEIEANRFAAELLMPRQLVRSAASAKISEQISGRDELIAELAREFDVSNEAMGYRLINLGVISS